MQHGSKPCAAPLVVFDGACLLCNSGVQFIVERDPAAIFRFTSLQSEMGQRIAARAGAPMEGRDATMLVVEAGVTYERSDAVLRIVRALGRTGLERWAFRWLASAASLVPRWLRNFVYNRVASNRHRFGFASETCWLPTDELRRRLAS